jgi:hypothetical protein
MNDNHPEFPLMTPTRAAKQLGVARGTVMYRVATKRYRSLVVGGVTFVVMDDQLAADVSHADPEHPAAA